MNEPNKDTRPLFRADRLLSAFAMSIQRHEAVFGTLETDVQKRLKTQQEGT